MQFRRSRSRGRPALEVGRLDQLVVVHVRTDNDQVVHLLLTPSDARAAGRALLVAGLSSRSRRQWWSTVPDIVGLRVAEATAMLEEASLGYILINVSSGQPDLHPATAPKAIVVEVLPEAGTSLQPGSTVAIRCDLG